MATYYVATGGSNSYPGTITQPWATLNYAWTHLSAGDTLYMRGGTYTYAMMGITVLSGKSGTVGNMITIQNYPGESPIIDFSALTPTSQIWVFSIHDADYIHLKGLRITSAVQWNNYGSYPNYGLIIYNHVSNSIFELLEIDHIGGWGIHVDDYCNNNLFLNCDSHHNSDRHSVDAWGGSDGFQCNSWDNGTPGAAATGNTIQGCRFWWNSDDGLDLRRCQGIWTIKNSWAWHSGHQPGERHGDADSESKGGDGEGFKLEGSNSGVINSTIRYISNCMAWECSAGFDLTPDPNAAGEEMYNCVSYNNQVNYIGEGCGPSYIKNCIFYKYSISQGYGLSETNCHHTYCNIDIPLTLTDADFLSVDYTGADGPRQPDGSLPNLNFLKPSSGSQLIGRGTAISGLTTDGAGNAWNNPPSLGAYEYNSTPVVAPTVTTSSVTGITDTTASSGGNVTSDGGASVTAKGVCWGTSVNPTISNSHISDGTGTGIFTSSITGLTQSTIYHIRAYATNSVGTAYGNDIQFVTTASIVLPTITTQAVTNISYTSATANGNLTSNGGDINAVKGVCWALHTGPTTANAFGSPTTGSGAFTVGFTGAAVGTLHYVRAYATNSAGTVYGNEVTFTTLSYSIPTLTTTPVTSITQTTATSGGTIISDGGATIIQEGYVWATHSSPILGDNTYSVSGTLTNVYSGNMANLVSNTTYYVRSYATNSVGTGYGNEVTFNTGGTIPSLNNISGHEISTTVWQIDNTTISTDGGSSITSKGVCWSLSNPPTISDSKTMDGSGNGAFTSTISGLSPSTTYYVRAYATNSAGTGYSILMIINTSETVSWLHAILIKIKNCFCQHIYSDWWLPSKDELRAMYLNLRAYNVGNFVNVYYWSSSEYSASEVWYQSFDYENSYLQPIAYIDKSNGTNLVRPCHSFVSSSVYNLRDVGPAFGWIFYIVNNGDGTYTYYETASTDIDWCYFSNITNSLAGTTTAVGTGNANTLALIGQTGFTGGAPKLCNDLVG
jgi:hypothetical protein